MKYIYKFYFLFICCFLLASCSEEKLEWGEGAAPGPVSDVTVKADNGAVILKWKNPTDESFDYVHISYVGTKGEERGKTVSKHAVDPATGYTTEAIYGLEDTKDYKFTLKACSSAGAASAPVEVSGTPLPPVIDLVINSVEAEADFGGVRVSWTNDWTENVTGKTATIVLSYWIDGKPFTQTKVASESGVFSFSGIPAESTDFSITVADNYGNESVAKTVTLTPYEESKISKSGWSIPGYNANSAAETIGYSSQAINEGAANKVIAIFDDNVNTFWHASWSSPSTSYPHWVIVDMGQEITISRIELTRRQGNNAAQVGQQILTCKAANAVNPNDPTSWTWEDHGTSSFDVTKNTPTSVRLMKNPKARYIKLYFGEDVKGSSNFAMLGEMTVYGSEQ